MSFTYEPLTEEECEAERSYPLLEPGIYNFTVAKATFKMSNSGQYNDPSKPSNPMIELQLCVYGNDGKEYTVFDYLVSTRKMAWKTRHFCDSVGLAKEFEEGKFDEHLCQFKSGKASIIYQPGKQKPGGGYYKDRNAVEDYVMTDKGAVKSELSGDKFNDDVPF